MASDGVRAGGRGHRPQPRADLELDSIVNNQPADVVVGQPDFTSLSPSANSPTAKSMRGPQGVWIQNGKLYVADTGNNRVLIFNRIPTANGAAADVVLGAPDFTTFVQPDLDAAERDARCRTTC